MKAERWVQDETAGWVAIVRRSATREKVFKAISKDKSKGRRVLESDKKNQTGQWDGDGREPKALSWVWIAVIEDKKLRLELCWAEGNGVARASDVFSAPVYWRLAAHTPVPPTDLLSVIRGARKHPMYIRLRDCGDDGNISFTCAP